MILISGATLIWLIQVIFRHLKLCRCRDPQLQVTENLNLIAQWPTVTTWTWDNSRSKPAMRDVKPPLAYCWPTVCDVGTTIHHGVIVFWLQWRLYCAIIYCPMINTVHKHCSQNAPRETDRPTARPPGSPKCIPPISYKSPLPMIIIIIMIINYYYY